MNKHFVLGFLSLFFVNAHGMDKAPSSESTGGTNVDTREQRMFVFVPLIGMPQLTSAQMEQPQLAQPAPQVELPQLTQPAPQGQPQFRFMPQLAQPAPQIELPQLAQPAPQIELPQLAQPAPRIELP